MRLKDKVAVVTGSARGLGKSMVLRMAAEGAAVVVSDINYDACVAVKSEIEQAGGVAAAIKCDVTKREEVEFLIQETVKLFSKVDIMVNNAGITRDAQMIKMTDEQWDLVLATNLKSMFLCCQAASKPMIEQGWGRIINISSIAGVEGNFGQANYSAAKAGAIGLTKTLCKELGKKGITVNVIAPGFMLTEMAEAIPKKITDAMIARIPVGRAGQPAEIASAVVFLASDEAAFITGQVLNVNGGMYV
ncbi:MAG: fabG 2 [Firmicutes bacterium]|nr:fabG 2 [Bacillota bacterium]